MRTLTREKLFGILVKNNYLQKKGGGIYIADKKDSPFCIFGNCNLQAYTQEGAGIASNLHFYLKQKR